MKQNVLVLLNKAPPNWLEPAGQVALEGAARYGELGLGAAELANWIELVRRPREGAENELNPVRLNPDLYLAAALAKGVPAAWALWREQLELPLVRWLTRLAGGVRLGEELVAELAGDLFAGKLREYRGDSALRTWLTVVARNRLTDRLRAEGRRGVSLTLWQGGEPAREPVAPEADVAEEVAGKCDGERLGRALREALEKLGLDEKRLLVRYFLQGARMRVLARDYGVNRTQVGRRLKAVCARIRALLAAKGEVVGDAEAPPAVTLEVLRLLGQPGSEAPRGPRPTRPAARQRPDRDEEPLALRAVAVGAR
ncbi:MAG: sigma-70 family RNA polymerase sigma factor [Candidatus Wallbacteria bacterium]|nr:sigma-70 family RNA polymerase sigma factor [Candidatus Wallbacteria bacterium]